MNKDGEAFQYLRSKFTSLSDAKIDERILVGPQIRKTTKDAALDQILQRKEKSAWEAFKRVIRGFPCSKNEKYQQLVKELLQKFQGLGCNISLKIHFLHFPLNFSPKSCGAVSDEHDYRLHF
ncbi:uncharacterized protein TNCV_1154091 [Trichonephila clavipes]|nr:uncharacterized protein TNCV_1154091 [Trichonephila clavipes]